MNRLSVERQEMILRLLTEGNSIRGIQRITRANRRTIIRLIREVGQRCQQILDERMINLNCNYLECDEIRTYVQKKEMRLKAQELGGERGDQYVFVALDRDTKLVPVFLVGKRDRFTTQAFVEELHQRIYGRFQITTDKFQAYYKAIEITLGDRVHYATIQKMYHTDNGNKRRGYSPARLQRVFIRKRIGQPVEDKICTSYVERQNLTIRTQCKRFTRLTNAFSKTLDCLVAALAIHFWWYNFGRVHQSLEITPAMAAGIKKRPSLWKEILV